MSQIILGRTADLLGQRIPREISFIRKDGFSELSQLLRVSYILIRHVMKPPEIMRRGSAAAG